MVLLLIVMLPAAVVVLMYRVLRVKIRPAKSAVDAAADASPARQPAHKQPEGPVAARADWTALDEIQLVRLLNEDCA